MNNLKPIMKEKTLGEPNYKPGLLKKKPFGKAAPKPTTNLMQRLTGK